MRERFAVIIAAVVLGGLAGAAAVLFLSRSPFHTEHRVEGRTLNEWTKWLEDEVDGEIRESAWTAVPQFPVGEAAVPLVALLDHPSEDTRQRAIAALVTLGPPTVPQLRVALRDPSPLKRANAIDVLRQLGAASSPAVDQIAQQLADPATGGAAAEYFVEHGSPPVAVTSALRVLEDGQSARRREAVDVLAKAPSDSRAVAALMREAAKPGDVVQASAFRAVCALPEPSRETIDLIASGLARPGVEQDARQALIKIGSPAGPAVAHYSEHKDAKARGLAVEVLSALAKNDPPIADSLVPFLYDSDANVSLQASEGLMPMWRNDPSLLRDHLHSASANARRWSLRAVVIIKPPVMEDAVALLDDPDESVREQADKAVRRLWSKRDAEVMAAMKEKDPLKRARLVRMLPFCSDSVRRITVMIDAMQDSDLNVRRAAVAALGQSLHSNRAVERLIDAMKYDASPTLRSDAAGALAPARSASRVAAALAAAEKDPDAAVAAAAAQARQSGRVVR